MTTTRRISNVLVPLLLAGAVIVGALAAAAVAYTKPAGGKWQIQDSFDQTNGGAMKVAANGKKIKKLKLNVGEDYVESCGAKQVRAKGKLKIKSFKKANGRWAVARQANDSSLLEAVQAKFKLGSETVGAKILILFDETGRLGETGRLELPDCTLNFHPRKG